GRGAAPSSGILSSLAGSRSCGGVLRDPPGKIFNSDGPQKDCVWTIKVKPHFHVVLAIPPLNLSCGKEYVELLDGPPGSEIIGKICGGISLVFRSSSNIATIKYLRTSGQRASPFHIYYYADPEAFLLLQHEYLDIVLNAIQQDLLVNLF
uniref:CUB domain-containing protein n=1 Tax=Sus scrofa TaxID=9823 RepID=A0A8D1VJS8_PIG